MRHWSRSRTHDGGVRYILWLCVLDLAILKTGHGSGSSQLLGFVVAARIWVVVYARVSRQFVGPAEALVATLVLAGVRFLARMRTDMPRLMFESVKSPVA